MANALSALYTPDVVYHYCSPTVFESIIENSVIWAADLRSMNDPREVKSSVKTAEDYLESLDFPAGTVSGDFSRILGPRFRSFNRFSRFFCSSFTYQPDDLYSWLNYGARGQGVAIGLRKDFFSSYYWQDVTYSDALFQQQLESIWSNAIAAIASGTTQEKQSVTAAIAMQRACVSTKHASWSNEREARLVLPIILEGDFDFDLTLCEEILKVKQVKFKSGAHGLRPYVELGLKRDGLNSIVEVIIGPNNGTSEDVMGAFLKSYGFSSVRLEKSKCEFR